MSATVYLRGGAVIENVAISWEAVDRARQEEREVITATWQPSYTPHDRSSFTLDVRVDEIAAIQRAGR